MPRSESRSILDYGRTFERLCRRCWRKRRSGDDEVDDEAAGDEGEYEDEDEDEDNEDGEKDDQVVCISVGKLKELLRRFSCRKCQEKACVAMNEKGHLAVSRPLHFC